MVMQVLQAMNPQNRVFISDQQVDYVISEVEALCQDEETALSEHELRAEAKSEGIVLPLDRLEFELPLSPTQMDAVILCAALEFDSAYEILFAFILNDISRRLPCPELFCACPTSSATASTAVSSSAVSAGSGSSGLSFLKARRRASFVKSFGSRPVSSTSCSTAVAIPPTSVATAMKSSYPTSVSVPPHVDLDRLARVGRAFKENEVGVVGVWGPRQAGPEDVAMAIVKAADRPLRKWALPDPRSFDA